jgi:hypothetical protein
MTATAAKLDTKVEMLPAILTDVGATVTETHALLASLKEAQQPAPPSPSPPPASIQASPTADACADKAADNVLLWGSLMGHHMLYAASVAFQKQIGFDLAALCKATSLNNDYCYGWTLACEHSGLLATNFSNGIMTVIAFNRRLADKIRESTLAEERAFAVKHPSPSLVGSVAKIDLFLGTAPTEVAAPPA